MRIIRLPAFEKPDAPWTPRPVVELTSGSESWTDVHLSNGNIRRVRLTMADTIKALGGTL